MKQQLFILLLTVLAVNSNAQVNFDKGYFIDNNGQKTECLIKNADRGNNPSSFEYKLSESSEPKN